MAEDTISDLERHKDKPEPLNEDEDDDYNESEDDDYHPSKKKGEGDDDDEDEDDDDDDEFQSAEGGLIKTRRQRQEEKFIKKQHKIQSHQKSSLDIDSIWESMNTPTPREPNNTPDLSNNSNNSTPLSTSTAPEKIKIKRTYEFAGEQITEEKWVDADSEEAKAHFNSVKIAAENTSAKESSGKNQVTAVSSTEGLKRRPPKRKRRSLIDDLLNGSSKTKLSTLEKSRLDWATYLDKNKISDELKFKNKGGYLDQQDFLGRVSSRQDTKYKEAKASSKKD
ncbi:hypothetical protein CANARDRAFT_201073 [[Candida] arabinofermentans NRRL YB-2248]|uniref:SWR1-complex protein 5 n=1 Tax=[Candida] arabinofermentans NRRL YB-2248 TaxID=983967 RepID=A0A1E4SY69_9ASCO|nr:hypothetical protein CANARDRAFT_201073 [[Candida] arabinofermentans NRRL YB-2248]